MTIGTVSIERRGHVLLMGLDRPAKRNAFDLPLWDALCRAYGELDRDDDLRCGVLFAHGDHFTGGLDLPQWSGVFSSGAWAIPGDGLDPLGLTGPRVRKPVVCAIQGICLTIGIELLLACDVRVAAAGARFGQIEVKRGIYPVGGATLRFPREVGWGNAMRWLLTGDEFDADEARRLGMIQEIVDGGAAAARDRAIALAGTIAAQAPLGVYATLASSRAALPGHEAAAAARLMPDLVPLMASADVQEGLRAFLERRPGRFTGR
ncbi:MAG: crotonase/enoyl-CoA hydratase family protein [Kofleriaceae bacterium]|nr:crotonase/enoyl-CoA hydratase family protein [Myxococcales bacterium]MCB9564923.1 crotonase/enoyl-CoA hydratase family protein [Kofleriaceae bacterium]